MPITSRPARASGSAATPPTAPSPTMTTSVFLRSMAMAASLGSAVHREAGVGVSGGALGLGARLHALLVGGDSKPDAGIADQVPADEIGVAAVIGIAERALDGVGAHEREERGGVGGEAGGDVLLHVGEHGILIGRRELGERRAFLRLRVDIDGGEVGGIAGARAAQRSCERAVDVMRRARLRRAGAVLVGGD